MEAFLDPKPLMHRQITHIVLDNLIENNEINKFFMMFDDREITILHYAAFEDMIDDEFLTKFIENGGNLNPIYEFCKTSPLSITIARKQNETALKLIKEGALVSDRELICYIHLYPRDHKRKGNIDKEFFSKLCSLAPKGNYLNLLIEKRYNFNFNDLVFMIDKLIENSLITDIPSIDPNKLTPELEEYLKLNNLYTPRRPQNKSIFSKLFSSI